jgi:membrane protein implicated in regulation of membrane protease activity
MLLAALGVVLSTAFRLRGAALVLAAVHFGHVLAAAMTLVVAAVLFMVLAAMLLRVASVGIGRRNLRRHGRCNDERNRADEKFHCEKSLS